MKSKKLIQLIQASVNKDCSLGSDFKHNTCGSMSFISFCVLCGFYYTFILNIVYYVYHRSVNFCLSTSSQFVTLQGLAGSFRFYKFLPVAMQLGDPGLAVSSLADNNNNVQVFGIDIFSFLKSRYSSC